MSDIVRLRDVDDRLHYTARGSQAHDRLLRDGATDIDAPEPTQDAPEVTDAAPSGQGDDHDTGATGGGSGKRQRAARTTDSGDRPAGEV